MKGRLTVSIIGVLAAASVALGVVVVTTVRASMVAQLDERLTDMLAHPPPPGGAGAPPVDPSGSGAVPAGGPTDESAPATSATYRGGAIIVIDADGRTVMSEPAGFVDDPLPLPQLPRGSGPQTFADGPQTLPAVSGGLRYRVGARGTPQGDLLVIGLPMDGVEATTEMLVWVVIITTAVVIGAGGAIAWLLAERALRPVDRMIRTAEAIAAGDLDRRVDDPGTGDELAALSAALDDMLAQIQVALQARDRSRERLQRFVADASHELRTPIASIRGYAELYRRGGLPPGEELDRSMARIESESLRLQRMVEDLLLLARLDERQPLAREVVDLSGLIRDAAADFAASCPSYPLGIDVPGRVVVLGDAPRLRQVIDNLLHNIDEHTPAGTSASIATRLEDGYVAMTVHDDGPGMEPEDRDRAFERFFRADRSRSRETGGAGLGLSIVSAVVQAHGGDVRVSGTPGGGTTFIVRLPVGSEAVGSLGGDQAPGETSPGDRAGGVP